MYLTGSGENIVALKTVMEKFLKRKNAPTPIWALDQDESPGMNRCEKKANTVS